MSPVLPREDLPLRILFVLHYPAHLRLFDSAIAELLKRGHTIHLAFDAPDKLAEGLEALEGTGHGLELLGALPRRSGFWGALARDLRRGIDYARYLHPEFVETPELRRRIEDGLPWSLRWLIRTSTLSQPAARLLIRLLLALEGAVPSSASFERWVSDVRPDVAVVSPLVNDASPQTDVVKAARALRVPSLLAVGSWDHLTTKGLIREHPDRVLLWNEAQAAEAMELHAVPGRKLTVTGAQPFDRWFDREPSSTPEDFRERAGLPPNKPFVLFVGSTATISTPAAELEFVRSWIAALRSSATPEIRDLAVLVRPHPYNPGAWERADVSDLGDVAVWPRGGANPVDPADRNDYFDSLYHSVGVVGINTSAMIEAAIVGRPVHTVRVPEFSETQAGTVHFRYLLPEHGGFLRVADSLPEHLDLLAETLTRPDLVADQIERFVGSFIRPRGVRQPATPIVASAVEDAARAAVSPFPPPAHRSLLRLLLGGVGVAVLLFDRPEWGGALPRLRRRYVKRLATATRRRRRRLSKTYRRSSKRAHTTLGYPVRRRSAEHGKRPASSSEERAAGQTGSGS